MTRLVRAAFLFASLAWAQNASVRGEIRDAPNGVDKYMVSLTSLDRSAVSEKAFVGGDGSFQFRSIPQGAYHLEVRNMHGETIKQQFITVVGPAFETSVSLGSTRQAALPAGGATVSVNSLRHDPEGRAAREYALGVGLLLKHNLQTARKHFENALKADPGFADAHLELGTTAFRMGELVEARQEFERAVQLDPKQTMAWGNLASLLFQTKAYEQAEAAASKGLAVTPHDPKLHFVVGASRYARGQTGADTAEHLELASKGYPNAHLLLAEMMLRSGEGQTIRMHLEAAMASSNVEVRTRSEYLIGKLRPANQ